MLLKFGVEISRLHDSVRRKLEHIEKVYKEVADMEAVITSTYEGTHKLSSLHYQNRAIDLRHPEDLSLVPHIIGKLKEALGKDFDVVVSEFCIHVEYDPK